jgi:hypothetical protein
MAGNSLSLHGAARLVYMKIVEVRYPHPLWFSAINF